MPSFPWALDLETISQVFETANTNNQCVFVDLSIPAGAERVKLLLWLNTVAQG